MKKKWIAIFLGWVLLVTAVLPVAANAEANTDLFVIDDADLLTNGEEAKLAGVLMDYSQSNQAQLVIVTVSDAVGDVDTYVEYVYDSMEFGYGVERDGVLLLLCMAEREYRILSNGYAGTAISEWEIDTIGETIVSDLSDGAYMQAFLAFANQCNYYLDGYINGFPFEFGTNLVFALIAGFVIGLIVALVLKSQLKSVRKQSGANVYVKPGSMQVTTRRDIFLYRNVTRTRKSSNSSSGGSRGSSRSVGGGRF